jgi:hypothetical protein
VPEISDPLRRFAIELRRIADARGGGSVIFSEPADGRGRVGPTRDRA